MAEQVAGRATTAQPKSRWWQELTPAHRRVAAGTFLGWTLDGYETYALIATVQVIVADLAANSSRPDFMAGLAIGITLLGWGIGGLVGGVLADKIGRRPVMLWSIVLYATFTGLTALVPSFALLIVLRFLTGLALGSEWCTGASMIQEAWPERARTKGAAIVQSGFGVGSLIAALVWLLIGYADPEGWRWMFVVGILPGLLVFWLRRNIPESERWEKATKDTEERTPLRSLLGDDSARSTVLLLLVVSLATVIGWYAISSFLPKAATALAEEQGVGNVTRFTSWTLIVYTVGSVCGYWTAAWVAERFGRVKLITVFLIGSFVMTIALYSWKGSPTVFMVLAFVNGAFTLGGFAWIPLYVPELFGSAVRATASGFVFNATRLVAWVGPLITGTLITVFGGVSTAAICMGVVYLLALAVVPKLRETRGEPLPA